jgi:RecA/RadA recombinase
VEQFGLEIVPKDITKRAKPETIQDQYADAMIFGESLKADEYGVYVVDSISSFFDEKGKERAEDRVAAYSRDREYEEKTMGMEMAKFLSGTYFKGICSMVETKNILYVVIAQYRQKQLPSGGTYLDLQNGEALKYYAGTRFKVTVAEDIKVKGRQVGAVLKMETRKARGPWPYRSCFVTLYYDYGIDNTTSNLDYLYDWRTATGQLAKSAEKPAMWDGIEMKREDMVRFIEDNNLEAELDARVISKWNEEEKQAQYLTAGRKKKFGE